MTQQSTVRPSQSHEFELVITDGVWLRIFLQSSLPGPETSEKQSARCILEENGSKTQATMNSQYHEIRVPP